MSQYNVEFTPQGPQAPQTADVLAHLRDRWQDAFDRQLNPNAATPQGQLITSETAIVQDKNNQLVFLINQFDPTINEGVYQDAIGRIYFIDRHPARPTTVQCQCMGLAGVVIPGADTSLEPALAQDDYGRAMVCQTTGTIPASGTITLPFACVTPGPLEVRAHTVTSIVRAIPGWDSIDNAHDGMTGQDVESRAAFERRRYNSVAKNARSVLEAVYAEIGNLEGVVDVLCRQNRRPYPVATGGVTLGPHSIYVAVLGGADADIARAIYESNSAGSDYNGNTSYTHTDLVTGAMENVRFMRPHELSLAVRVTIRPTSATPGDIEARIKSTIVDVLYGAFIPPGETDPTSDRIHIGETLYASRFYCPLMHAGVENLVAVHVAVAGPNPAWGDSVAIQWDQYPNLLMEDVQVVPGA